MRKVNWANPITRNMFFCVAAGSLNNLINRHGVQFSQLTPGFTTIEYQALEEVHRFYSSSNYYATSADYGTVVGSNIRNANTQFIYFKPFIPSDNKSHPGELLGFSPADAGYLSWNSTNPGLRYGGHYGTSWYNSQASFTLAAHQWYAVAFRWDGDRISLWINGVKDGEIDVQNSPSPDLSYVTEMGGGSSGGYFAGDIAVACQWDRALTDTEMTRLAADPFQVLEQRPIIGAHQLPTHVDYGFVKRPWTKQPPAGTPVDWGNSINEFNYVVHAFNEITAGGFRGYHRRLGDTYTSPIIGDTGVASGLLEATIGTKGHEVHMLPTYDFSNNKDFNLTKSASIGNHWHLPAAGNTSYGWTQVAKRPSNGSFCWCANKLAILVNSSNQLVIRDIGYGTTAHTFTNITIPFDEWITYTVVVENIGEVTPNESGYLSFWLNGELVLDRDQTGTWDNAGNNFPFYVGYEDFAGSGNESSHALFIYHASDQAGEWTLSRAAVEELHKNPWQIFKPREIMVPINEDLPELGTFEDPRPRFRL